MKTGWLVLMIAMLVGLVAFSTRLAFCKSGSLACPCGVETQDKNAALGWMKSELALSDSDFAKVSSLHAAYVPQCDAMCERMAQSGAKVTAILQHSRSVVTPEAETALREYESLRSECQRATLQHLADTATLMNPESRQTFLEKVLPHLFVTHQHVSDVTK